MAHYWPAIVLILILPLLGTTIASPSAYVSDYGKSTLIDTIRLGEKGWENGSPSSIVVNPATNTIYVANRNSDTIVIIDAVSQNVTNAISVGYGPLDLVLNPSTDLLYVVNGYPNTVSVIDVATNNVITTIDLTELDNISSLQGLAFNSKTNKLYVLIIDGTEAFIAVMDGSTNKVDEIFKFSDLPPDYDVGRAVRDIAINSSTNMIYVTRDFDSLLVIDGSTNRVVDTITVDGPTTVAVNEKTNTIYSGNFFSQSISIIDGSNNTVISTLEQIEPQRIEVDERTNTIYVSGYGGLTIIDGKTHQVTNWIRTGEFSEGVALNPDTGLLYVTNAGSNTVSVIRTASETAWKTAFALGKYLYSEPPLPDEIFKIRYRAINGSVQTFDPQPHGVVATVKSEANGILQIIYPRNYPYTNNFSGSPLIEPVFFVDGMGEQPSESYATDCFFRFSIPFANEAKIELAWTYLAVEQLYHGDYVPDYCLPDTKVEEIGSLTPLQQSKAGVNARDIVCPEELTLIVSPSKKPYCATQASAEILKVRWNVG